MCSFWIARPPITAVATINEKIFSPVKTAILYANHAFRLLIFSIVRKQCSRIQLGTDYYGRALVRLVSDRCPGLDGHFDLRAGMAPGDDLAADEYLDRRSDGLFGAQKAFQRLHMFEAFETLARQTEGAGFTVGLTYVRKSDGRESEAALQSFSVRRVYNS